MLRLALSLMLIIMTKPLLILVIGSSGQLGQSLKSVSKQYPQFQFTYSTRKELDLFDLSTLDNFFSTQHFDVIINCAAYTAVDRAEQEPELAEQVNHIAVRKLADIAKQNASLLIHLSTDYVFNGRACAPYSESDTTQPKSVYGETKYKGEQAIIETDCHALIIRTSWLYSEFGHNFVKTMLRLGKEQKRLSVVYDQVGTPTYARDLASAIMVLVSQRGEQQRNDNYESIYHYSNEGVCSWYDFAKSIFEVSHINCELEPIETKDYPTSAQRPHYSLLNKQKIKDDFQLTIPYWRDSLSDCLQNLKEEK